MIAFLPIELDELLNRAKVRLFIVAGSRVLDVVQCERVLAGGSYRRTSTRRGALKSLVSITMSVFFATETLDEAVVEALDELLNEQGCDVLLDENLADRCEWILFAGINRQNQLNGECNLNRGLSHEHLSSPLPVTYQLLLRCGRCRPGSKRSCDATKVMRLFHSHSVKPKGNLLLIFNDSE